ncbi:MAG: cupin domain-containing protein, partial [Myxococcota bacterium]
RWFWQRVGERACRYIQAAAWTVVAGRIAITIDGVERMVEAGGAAIIPPNTPHAARPVGACRAVISDSPRRAHLPGMSEPR